MIILSLLNGSRLYHLDNLESDTDIINIYVKDRTDYYLNRPDDIKRVKMQGVKGGLDITYIDYLTFSRQLIKCNPNFVIPSLEMRYLYKNDKEIKDLVAYQAMLSLDSEKVKSAFNGMIKSLVMDASIKGIHGHVYADLAAKKVEYMQNYLNSLLLIIGKNKKAYTRRIKEIIDYVLKGNRLC